MWARHKSISARIGTVTNNCNPTLLGREVDSGAGFSSFGLAAPHHPEAPGCPGGDAASPSRLVKTHGTTGNDTYITYANPAKATSHSALTSLPVSATHVTQCLGQEQGTTQRTPGRFGCY